MSAYFARFLCKTLHRKDPILTIFVLLLASALFLRPDEAFGARKGGGKPGGSTAPRIDSVSPSSGSIDGGLSVTIHGRKFTSGTEVSFGGVAATGESVRNSKRMTAITPAYTEGAVDVTVTNPDGQSATLTGGFTYEGAQPKPLPPTAPSGLSAGTISATQINLGWQDNASDEDGFVIERGLNGGAHVQIATTGSDSGSYSDSGLSPDNTYSYRVAAYNAAGNSGYSNTAEASTPPQSAVVAFPGAEGFGTSTPGGRGGVVVAVDNLNDSGPGSLRAAVESSGARIVVFRTGGTIELQSPIKIRDPYITIAGQTAPGGGILLKGEGLIISSHDIIVRGLRIRIGDLGSPSCCRDGINISTSSATSDIYNVVIDHCSVSWAIDENIATWESSSNNFDLYDVTIQWTISSEALHDSIHIDEGDTSPAPHSMGLLIGRDSERISIHHNLLGMNNSRNPRMDSIVAGEVVNNLIFAWGKDAPTRNAAAPGTVHVLNNFYHSGDTSRPDEIYIDDDTQLGSNFYIDANLTDDARVSTEPFPSRILNRNNYPIENFPQFSGSGISVDSTSNVFDKVLASVGATVPERDAVDIRVVASVQSRSGGVIDSQAEVGGWSTISAGTPLLDSDGDGMPDSWEVSKGLEALDSNDRNGLAPSGYTWIEEYINSLIPIP
jgi:hypothetical protein